MTTGASTKRPKPQTRTDAQRIRHLTHHLRDLTEALAQWLQHLDTIMAHDMLPLERAKRLARLANMLDVAHETAVHCGLGVSLATIARRKQRRGERT